MPDSFRQKGNAGMPDFGNYWLVFGLRRTGKSGVKQIT
jgi:hypothetical protein